MSLTPQEASRAAYSQNGPSQHIFRLTVPATATATAHLTNANVPNPNITNSNVPNPNNVANPSPLQQQRAFGSMGVLRPSSQQHKSPYPAPYTTSPAPQRNNGNVSAEQQIAQGVLSHTSGGSGSNTPQRRPPPLGTTIHMPPSGTPQNVSMSVNHAMNPTSTMNSGQMQAGSPSLQHLNIQRSAMNSSPGNNSTLGGPNQIEQADDSSQDLSMIDPQLAIDQQLNSSSTAINDVVPTSGPPPVVQGAMLSPPPSCSFPTFDALFAYAQAHALAHGYAFVIGRSKRDNRGLKKVFLICDRGGQSKEKPREPHERQRKTRSRKCGCEFGVYGIESKTAWLMRGRIDGEHLVHNHPPSESPTEHPGARKLDPKAIAAVKALEENGVSVKETLEILHRDSATVRYLPRDIYNARAAIKRDPSRVEATELEALPTFYKKPPMSFEEKLRAELRTEVANAQAEAAKTKELWRAEVEELKEQLRNKDKMIQKFEMFIDICNERVMVQRERLEEPPTNGGGAGGGSSSGGNGGGGGGGGVAPGQ